MELNLLFRSWSQDWGLSGATPLSLDPHPCSRGYLCCKQGPFSLCTWGHIFHIFVLFCWWFCSLKQLPRSWDAAQWSYVQEAWDSPYGGSMCVRESLLHVCYSAAGVSAVNQCCLLNKVSLNRNTQKVKGYVSIGRWKHCHQRFPVLSHPWSKGSGFTNSVFSMTFIKLNCPG